MKPDMPFHKFQYAARTLPPDAHGLLDYALGAAILTSPYLTSINEVRSARYLFLTVGSGWLGYSLLTKYRYSALSFIPLGAHRALDCFAGILLAAGPRLLSYKPLLSRFEYALHWMLGAGAVVLAARTRRAAPA